MKKNTLKTTSIKSLHFGHDKNDNEIPHNKPVENSTSKCHCKTLKHTHSYCSNICGCFKAEKICSLSCGCKGICSNGKPISDELFFKVWRNKYIRNQITGEENILKIEKFDSHKNKLENDLKGYGILYDIKSIIENTKLISENGFDHVWGIYKKNENEKRKNEFREKLTIYNNRNSQINIFREKSKIIETYSKAFTPEEKLAISPLSELIEKECNEIKKIREILEIEYKKEGLEFENSESIHSFIKDFNYENSEDTHTFINDFNYEELLSKERTHQSGLKKKKIEEHIKGLETDRLILIPILFKHYTLFKPHEIVSNKVSYPQIMRLINYLKRNEAVRRKFICLGVKSKSGIIKKYLNSSSIENVTLLENILNENNIIESIEEQVVENFFKSLDFNEISTNFIIFIRERGGRDVNFDGLLRLIGQWENNLKEINEPSKKIKLGHNSC